MPQTNTPTRKRDIREIERKRGENHLKRLEEMRSCGADAINRLLPWTLEFAKREGRYPTRRETQIGLELSSVSLVNNRIDYLVATGNLIRGNNGRISIPGYRFTLVPDLKNYAVVQKQKLEADAKRVGFLHRRGAENAEVV